MSEKKLIVIIINATSNVTTNGVAKGSMGQWRHYLGERGGASPPWRTKIFILPLFWSSKLELEEQGLLIAAPPKRGGQLRLCMGPFTPPPIGQKFNEDLATYRLLCCMAPPNKKSWLRPAPGQNKYKDHVEINSLLLERNMLEI